MGRARITPIDRPVPGRRPLDGSRALARLMKAGKIDRRTAPAKALERIVAVLSDDCGGPDAMPGAARLLVDRIGALTVRLILREQRLLREAADGIDDPASDKGTIALHNAFSRSLGRLEEMRAAAGARKDAVPSLAEYLQAKAGQNTAGNGTTATTTSATLPMDAARQPAPACAADAAQHNHSVNPGETAPAEMPR
jgi:hypothetical protein